MRAASMTRFHTLLLISGFAWLLPITSANAAGANWTKGSGQVSGISIRPDEIALKKAGDMGQLTVKARFSDGSEEDITPLCDYRSNDDAVAEVSPQGQIRSLRAGDTAIIVSYRGNVLPVRVLVPLTTPSGFTAPAFLAVNYIDHEILAKLKRLNIAPSELSGD